LLTQDICKSKVRGDLNHFKAIAFTHATVGLDKVAKLYIPEDAYNSRLGKLKENLQIDELMFVATCNRVEYYFTSNASMNNKFIRQFFEELYPEWGESDVHWAIESTEMMDGLDAVRHMFHVASSLDSMVVGEREILTQMRKSFDIADKLGFTGDFIRIAMRKTIENAKQVFTETNIANRPVSVVNLANRELRNSLLPLYAQIIVVGAGVTNQAMLRKLKKQGYHNFKIYNRTLAKAQALVDEVGGEAFPLNELENHNTGFDALITCTGAPGSVISSELYGKLLKGDTTRKMVIDLAVPNDLDTEALALHNIEYVEVKGLKKIAEANLEARKGEMVHCESIIDANLEAFETVYQERQVELAMREVPSKVKEIKTRAYEQVFAKDIEQLDESSKQLLDEIVTYMEKKYISVPMKMAREILVENARKSKNVE